MTADEIRAWLDEDPERAASEISQALGLLATHGGYRELDPADMWWLKWDQPAQ